MKVTGKKLIDVLCHRLEDNGHRCYDSEIMILLKTLSSEQLWQIVSFGDVQKWHNERVSKAVLKWHNERVNKQAK